mgnify:CR=1 FL=1|tara:strand:- start:4347 stop:4520 length:174 start_codon:yes stop_codon:yes gene_type:complete
MRKIQIVGLALILICGVVTQVTNLKQNDVAVWVLALGTVVGIILVISDWLKPNKPKE